MICMTVLIGPASAISSDEKSMCNASLLVRLSVALKGREPTGRSRKSLNEGKPNEEYLEGQPTPQSDQECNQDAIPGLEGY